jgi:hypothetical protein
MPDWIGYRWLIEHHSLTVTQALRIETVIGPTRSVVTGIAPRSRYSYESMAYAKQRGCRCFELTIPVCRIPRTGALTA